MQNNARLSRRSIFALALLPVTPSSTGNDEKLCRLNSEMKSAFAALENEGDPDRAIDLLDRMEAIATEMVAIPSSSIEGLRAKADATAWAIEHESGLLDPSSESTTNLRLAASIVQDLLSQ